MVGAPPKTLIGKGPKDNPKIARRRWYTVEFPAWRFEKSERLWAALAKTIYEVPQTQMGSIWSRGWFRFRLEWSRLGRWWFLVKNLGLPLAAAGGAVAWAGFAKSSLGLNLITSLGGGVLAAAALTLHRFSGIIGNPFKRSVDAHARRVRFQDQLGFSIDAQRDIEQLMKKLAPSPNKDRQRGTDAPATATAAAVTGNGYTKDERAIAVFVDDLDRCSPAPVVEVIEAINQIFNSIDARCVFILGMDRQMVASSIEVAYEGMVEHLKERENPLAEEYGPVPIQDSPDVGVGASGHPKRHERPAIHGHQQRSAAAATSPRTGPRR